MNNIVNKVLLIIVMLLIALFAYKTLKVPSPTSAEIAININDQSSTQLNEVKKTEKIIQEYLLNNPEIIIQAMKILQQREKQKVDFNTTQYIEENQQEINSASISPILGNTSGNIIIASFYDYNCGYCKKGDKFINQLIELNSEVRVVLKPLPILGDTSYYASSIALAVYKMFPSKFQIIHDNLIEMTSITRTTVEKLLTDNNLDPLLITEEASKEEIRNIIKNNTQIARNLKIQGVPAYIINGKLMPGMMDLEQLKIIISDIKKQGKNISLKQKNIIQS